MKRLAIAFTVACLIAFIGGGVLADINRKQYEEICAKRAKWVYLGMDQGHRLWAEDDTKNARVFKEDLY